MDLWLGLGFFVCMDVNLIYIYHPLLSCGKFNSTFMQIFFASSFDPSLVRPQRWLTTLQLVSFVLISFVDALGWVL